MASVVPADLRQRGRAVILADLNPKFLAWLRKEKYVNGFGPRSIVVSNARIVIPCHPDTPGLKVVFEQHDLAYLLGGTDVDRLNADDTMNEGIALEAHLQWFWRRWPIEAARKPIYYFCREYLSSHFAQHSDGPRNQAQLMARLKYSGAF